MHKDLCVGLQCFDQQSSCFLSFLTLQIEYTYWQSTKILRRWVSKNPTHTDKENLWSTNVTTKPWQLKPILNPSEGTVSKRFTASGFKRKRKRSYEGRWFAQSRTIYRIWWDFLLRAYQSPDITVDVEFYERWGDPDWFQSIDVWETGYARKYYDPWFIKRGAELFAEHPDRGIRVLGEMRASWCCQVAQPRSVPSDRDQVEQALSFLGSGFYSRECRDS